ncbi:YlzJ-like family protein [Collibacillus ludicampi]|nr:YlzJ-like family protein [Collibacillus ludicampi]
MMYWAAIPMEAVFDGFETMTCNWKEIEYQGVKLLVEPYENGLGKVVRLLSPDPYDYLKADFAPGAVIPLHDSRISRY